MADTIPGVSAAFQAFLEHAPGHAKAWMGAVQGLDAATALDQKTAHLAYLAVLSALYCLRFVWRVESLFT